MEGACRTSRRGVVPDASSSGRRDGFGRTSRRTLGSAHQRTAESGWRQSCRKRADVEPGKVLESRFDGHRVAQGAQQVVRAHQHEEIAEGERDGGFLAGSCAEYLADQRE
jgi:hypothetical protein